MQPTNTDDPRCREALELVSALTDDEIQAVRDLLNQRPRYPRPLTRADFERIAAARGYRPKWVEHQLARHQQRAADDRQGTPKVTLTEAEMLAIRNLLRVTGDPFEDVEEGAGAPLGTLDALNDRIAACLGIR